MSGDQRRAVRVWLECVDCGEEVLASLDSLADWSVETALILAMQGPPDDVRTRVTMHLRAAYQMAIREMGETPSDSAEYEYVRQRLAGFVTSYQWRAVAALGRIGTERARRALSWALRFESQYPVHVATAIRTQLADSIVAVTATLDTVPVAASVHELPTVRVYSGNTSWAGAAVTFEVRDGGRVRGSRRITDDDGLARIGEWFADSLPGENVLLAKIPRDTIQFTVLGVQ